MAVFALFSLFRAKSAPFLGSEKDGVLKHGIRQAQLDEPDNMGKTGAAEGPLL